MALNWATSIALARLLQPAGFGLVALGDDGDRSGGPQDADVMPASTAAPRLGSDRKGRCA